MGVFNKKTNQKKRGESRLLDVNATTEQLWRRRRRLMFRLAAISILMISLAAGWRFGWPVLKNRMVQHRFFKIAKIEINTNGGLTYERLLQISGITTADNLYDINLPRIQSRLESEPAIRSATLMKAYPGALKLRVRERIPVARVEMIFPFLHEGVSPFRDYQIDDQGMVLLAPESRHVTEEWSKHCAKLPLLTGLRSDEFHMGRRLEDPKVRAALTLFREFPRFPQSHKEKIERVDIASAITVNVHTDAGTELIFGLSDISKQLHRWQLVVEQGKREGLELQKLDLSVHSNLPVTWRTNDVPAGENLTAALTTP